MTGRGGDTSDCTHKIVARYRVAVHESSEEGYAVWIPGLPGCVSQGETEDAALENIADALRDYLAVRFDDMARSGRHMPP